MCEPRNAIRLFGKLELSAFPHSALGLIISGLQAGP